MTIKELHLYNELINEAYINYHLSNSPSELGDPEELGDSEYNYIISYLKDLSPKHLIQTFIRIYQHHYQQD